MPSQGPQKNDRRSRKTREALANALIKLVQEKPFHSITVAELADEADINRVTFYLHYCDIPHMVETIQREICDEVTALLHIDEQARIDDINEALVRVFQRFSERRSFFAAMFGENGDQSFADDVIMYLWTCVCKLENSPVKGQEDSRGLASSNAYTRQMYYKYIFYASGFIGLIKAWVVEGNQESPAEMAMIVKDSLAPFAAA